MNCQKCGAENSEEAKVCCSCGLILQAEHPPQLGPDIRICGLAIASFVLGVLAILTFWLTAIPSIIMGIVSLIKIEKSGGKLTGKGFAIAGIVVPVVVLIPLLAILANSKANYVAKTAVCRCNLYQWALAWKMYTNDNKGFFLEGDNWPELLKPYYGDDTLLFCPTATKTQGEGGKIPFTAWQVESTKGSYGVNLWVTRNAQGRRSQEKLWASPNVKGATSVPIIFDCLSPGISPLETDKPPEYKNQLRDTANDQNEIRDCCIDRHSGTTQVLLMDWSVGSVKLRELWELRWHRQWNQSTEPEWPEWML